MQLLAFCASAISVGILLLIGFLVMARELFSKSIFGAPHEGAPHEPDKEAGRAYMNEDCDGIPSGRDPGAGRRRHERTALRL
jgi:hypothetical protein